MLFGLPPNLDTKCILDRPREPSMEFRSLATVAMVTVAKEQNSIDGSLSFTKIHLVSKFGGNPKSTG